jgi:Predicted transcriptional regulators
VALNPVVERVVLHWGEMGSRWGVNRTVAQIHALLYLPTARCPPRRSPKRSAWRAPT